MEYIIYLPLIVFAFFIMFMWIQGLDSHIDKHKSLIQNLESSIDTQKRLTKILNAELWKIQNPPKYKIGDKINDPTERSKNKFIITEVRLRYSDSTPKQCSYEQPKWLYVAIDLKTGDQIHL